MDITVQAQGEETFAEILARLEKGQTMDGCQGCTYRASDGRIRANPPRPLRNINTFRPHDYNLLPVERYYELKGKPQLDYISSQGCAFRCAFCSDPFVYGRKWVGLEPERMGEEIEALWHRYQFKDVNFQDETFFTYTNRVEGIADEFIRRKLPITWAADHAGGSGRASDRRADGEVQEVRAAAGHHRRRVRDRRQMMDWIKKDIKLEQVFIERREVRSAIKSRSISLHRRLSRRNRGERAGIAGRGETPARHAFRISRHPSSTSSPIRAQPSIGKTKKGERFYTS